MQFAVVEVTQMTPQTSNAGMENSTFLGCFIKEITPSFTAGSSFRCPAAAYTTALSTVSTKGVTVQEAIIAEPIAIERSTCNGTFLIFVFVHSEFA